MTLNNPNRRQQGETVSAFCDRMAKQCRDQIRLYNAVKAAHPVIVTLSEAGSTDDFVAELLGETSYDTAFKRLLRYLDDWQADEPQACDAVIQWFVEGGKSPTT